MKISVLVSFLRFLLVTAPATITVWSGHAQTFGADVTVLNATGTVEGRVFNQTTGNALRSAVVSVVGTGLQTYTDEEGFYRISRVPVGMRNLDVTYSGLTPQKIDLSVSAGSIVRRDIMLDDVLRLEAFTVEATQLSQEGVAMQEQRMAPNIKTVIAANLNRGEGNLGEYFKYTPGLVMGQNPQSPADVAIRGMPSSGTLILSDGAQFATASLGSRAVDLGLVAPGNIDRIEISKTPTPDIPANAVGGSINLVTKTAFSRKTPQLNYNVFGTYSALGGFKNQGADSGFSGNHGVDGKISVGRIQPSFDLSYLRPINDSLGVTLSLSKSSRYGDWPSIYPGWNQKQLTMNVYRIAPTQVREEKASAAAKVEWKLRDNTFAAAYSYANQRSGVRGNQLYANFGAAATGGPTFTENTNNTGVMGTGSLGNNNQYKDLELISLTHKYRGKMFTIDSGLGHSSGRFDFRDMEDGFVNAVNATLRTVQPNNTLTALRIRGDFYNGGISRPMAKFSATDAAGKPVDIFNGDNYLLDSFTSGARWVDDKLNSAYLNISRELSQRIPVTIKVGGAITQQKKDDRGGAQTWAFAPPGGNAARVAGNYDLISEGESTHTMYKDVTGQPVFVRYLSSAKIKGLYDQRPELFVKNEASGWTNDANAYKQLEETVSAAYARADVKLLSNRLLLVGGVRLEETRDDGRGVRNDLRATYQKDVNGKLILNAAGQPIRVAGDALQLAKLQYIPLGTHSENKYHGYYPSANANFTLNEFVVFRAGYAKTIGRPDLANIIPGITVATPTAGQTAHPLISIIDTRLAPWTANNYDLTAEFYRWNGATASVSLFRKEVSGFFVRKTSEATSESLARIGLSDEYLGYDLSELRNGGDARVEGTEFTYRQSLGALLPAARGFDVFGNMALMAVKGPSANDFTNFSPKTASGGVSYTRGKVRVDLRFNYVGWRRTGISAESTTVRANSYAYFAPQKKVDGSVSYTLSKHYTVYFDVRNMFDAPQNRGVWASDTPGFARMTLLQTSGALWALGVKGSF
ncbi:MAG: TonB-dependent receptor [Opitutaceae bacterium]